MASRSPTIHLQKLIAVSFLISHRYYTVRTFRVLYLILPPIRESRDKPRDFNLKYNLCDYYFCFFSPFYTLFLYSNSARLCQSHDCTQFRSMLFMPIHAESFISPTPSVTVPPRENRLPLEPVLQDPRASYPPQRISFVFFIADPGSPRTLTAPYPRRPSLGGSKRTSSAFPTGHPSRSDPSLLGYM